MAHIVIAAKRGPVRKAIRGLLTAEGHKIRCAENGADAYAAICEEQTDLVICDAFMPVVDGVALMMMGRKSHRARYLLMSEDPYLAYSLAQVDVDVDSVIAKPFNVQTLRAEVQRLLGDTSEAA